MPSRKPRPLPASGSPAWRLERAQGLLEEGRFEQARAALAGAFPRLLRPERDFLEAEALRSQGHFSRAARLYRGLTRRPPGQDASLWLEACLGLVGVLRSLGATAEARRVWARGRALAGGRRDAAARFELEGALIERAEGRHASSLAKLSRLLALARRELDWAGAGFLLWARGGARRFSGDLEGSRRDFESSLAAFKGAGDSTGQAYALFGLGGVLRIQGRLAAAQKAYAEAGRRLAPTQDLFGKAYAHCGLANVLRQRGLLGEAERHYLRSHRLYSRLEDWVDLAYVDWGLGQIELKRGNLARAEPALERALRAFSRHGETRGEVLAECSLAALWHARGRTTQAEALFDKAVRRARKAGLHAHLEIYT